MTPYELLNGRKPKMTYLRAFGYKYFILNNGKKALEKFDAKSDLLSKQDIQDGEFTKVPGEAIDIANGKTDLMSQVKQSDEEDVAESPKGIEEPGPSITSIEAEHKATNVVLGTPDAGQRSESHTSVDVNDGSNMKEPGSLNPEVQTIDTPIATATRLDMDEPGSSVNEAMYRGIIGFYSSQKESHLKAAKRILRYLKGTHDLVLFYPLGDNFDLVAYADNDYAKYLVDIKNEYVANVSCCAQLLWIKQQFEDFDVFVDCVPLWRIDDKVESLADVVNVENEVKQNPLVRRNSKKRKMAKRKSAEKDATDDKGEQIKKEKRGT
ncbi:uncharacterized protein [Nicotiana tomentosiformis]|uniref:uncharacterized protein n=1 Tax=Nicotiana tomentosiformis TaxID=4098 RepID=UPI00388CBE6D